MSSVIAFAGFAGGMALGFAFAAALMAADRGGRPIYSDWLGRTCWVRPLNGRGEWEEHVVVAVSWKGAVCVRNAENLDGTGYWISKRSVPFRVSFEDVRGRSRG